MSALNDLVAQIEDANLRERIAKEVERLAKQKKFGLVFEDHLPECSPLYDIPVKVGAQVAKKTERVNDIYRVLGIKEGVAECLHKESKEVVTLPVAELVTVAEFGEPIYPYLKPLDSVCNSPESDLWHTLIEADNYHALQLLEYLYAGKVDCIYIDPPYNTGAKDWKYNNDYVDSNDSYRHSKWLSFIQKRLQIAKKLLNPKDSTLIITIDEKEYLHLGCLLEEMFPEAKIQMITSVINVKASMRREFFSRAEEYIFFVMFGSAYPSDGLTDMLQVDERFMPTNKSEEKSFITWQGLRRRGEGTGPLRKSSPGCFYPVFIKKGENSIHSVGEALPLQVERNSVVPPEGTWCGWPIRQDGSDGRWQINRERFIEQWQAGTLFLGRCNESTGECSIKYLKSGDLQKINSGELIVIGKGKNGEVIVQPSSTSLKNIRPKTVWFQKSHDAGNYGTTIINSLIGGGKFSFPKSLYAVHDAIRFFVAQNPKALIVDFFAGSGTTLHAVNLLNAEDGGARRCIMVTNNEVSAEESKQLRGRGYSPGSTEWDKFGIARYVTWPRTVCSITGKDINGEPLKGNYLGSDRLMSQGFKANAAFFSLGFLDKTKVALGSQFCELLPILWMKAGARGKCPEISSSEIPNLLVLPENNFAVLVDERYYMEFVEELDKNPEIETVFIVTDSDAGYRDMIVGMEAKNTYQLYRDYLDNFRINSARR